MLGTKSNFWHSLGTTAISNGNVKEHVSYSLCKMIRFALISKFFSLFAMNYTCRGMISFIFLCGSMYLGLVILSWGTTCSWLPFAMIWHVCIFDETRHIVFIGKISSLKMWNSFMIFRCNCILLYNLLSSTSIWLYSKTMVLF